MAAFYRIGGGLLGLPLPRGTPESGSAGWAAMAVIPSSVGWGGPHAMDGCYRLRLSASAPFLRRLFTAEAFPGRIFTDRSRVLPNALIIRFRAHCTRAEDYVEEEQAVAHVRRLLDIVACTTTFGSKNAGGGGNGKTEPAASSKAKKQTAAGSPTAAKLPNLPSPPPEAEISPISDKYGMAAIQPPPKLSSFYDFFSFSHLTSPLIFIKRSDRRSIEEGRQQDHFEMEVSYFEMLVHFDRISN
ncbi:hypothetical protein ACLOJK_027664 [Asimina triloba]